LVEVKRLHIGPLSLRTKVMRELRQLKDLRHENLNTFVGLLLDQNAPALVFEYGQRGSLEVRRTRFIFIQLTTTRNKQMRVSNNEKKVVRTRTKDWLNMPILKKLKSSRPGLKKLGPTHLYSGMVTKL
jgi:hypothetical protein